MLHRIRTRCVTYSVAISLAVPAEASAQGWDDVGFWAADYTLNVLQNKTTGELVKEHAEVYTVLKNGYFVVRTLLDDNHSLHREFFEELARVNPVVANYYKVGLTVKLYQGEFRQINRDVPQLVQALKGMGAFTEDELRTIENVFYGMVRNVTSLVEELALVAIPGEGDLQMMDSERIATIDRIHAQSLAVVRDLRDFRRLLLQLATNRNPAGAREISQLYAIRP
jgi:hypothetical protein